MEGEIAKTGFRSTEKKTLQKNTKAEQEDMKKVQQKRDQLIRNRDV